MEITSVFISLKLAVTLFGITIVVFFGSFVNGLMKKIEPLLDQTVAEVSVEASSLKCTLRGTPRSPAFSKGGDFVVGGVFFYTTRHTRGFITTPQSLSLQGAQGGQ